MQEFFESCVERYRDLGGLKNKSLPKVETPFLDESALGSEEWEGESSKPVKTLTDSAARVLMNVLYGARMCRFDLLRATCALARKVLKWDQTCDK